MKKMFSVMRNEKSLYSNLVFKNNKTPMTSNTTIKIAKEEQNYTKKHNNRVSSSILSHSVFIYHSPSCSVCLMLVSLFLVGWFGPAAFSQHPFINFEIVKTNRMSLPSGSISKQKVRRAEELSTNQPSKRIIIGSIRMFTRKISLSCFIVLVLLLSFDFDKRI